MHIECPECGFSRKIADAAVPEGSSLATCPKCGFRFRFREEEAAAPDGGNSRKRSGEKKGAASAEGAASGGRRGNGGIPLLSPKGSVPWEYPDAFMRPDGFIHTLKLLATQPWQFFGGINPASSIIPSWIMLLLSNIPFIGLSIFQLRNLEFTLPETQEKITLLSSGALPEMIAIPLIIITIYQFISSAIIYGVLSLIHPKPGSAFRTVFKTIAYSRIPMLLAIVPAVGTIFAWMSSLALLFIGIRHACGLTWTKTVLTLLPFLLLNLLAGTLILRVMLSSMRVLPL
ncbi:MAG: zinc-ribbon domain-containing protein [Deltaproteobacteria bacterium]|jgi:hypothetical protein|nr:zinc-ribbon domain-containing protein [Deltaproteobacteria bacterium]